MLHANLLGAKRGQGLQTQSQENHPRYSAFPCPPPASPGTPSATTQAPYPPVPVTGPAAAAGPEVPVPVIPAAVPAAQTSACMHARVSRWVHVGKGAMRGSPARLLVNAGTRAPAASMQSRPTCCDCAPYCGSSPCSSQPGQPSDRLLLVLRPPPLTCLPLPPQACSQVLQQRALQNQGKETTA